MFLGLKSKSINNFKFRILSKPDGTIKKIYILTDSQGQTPTLRHHSTNEAFVFS
jgi:hypothetical protein